MNTDKTRRWSKGKIIFLIGYFLFTVSASAVSLKVVRPEPSEALTIADGFTFVIGTVEPADSKVVCNGTSCDVDQDGAFIGFVPIRRMENGVEQNGKWCDAQFEFVTRHGKEETKTIIFSFTPRSPSAAVVAQAVFDPPKTIRITKDQWIGLEGEHLGKLIYIPEGSFLTAKFGSVGSYRCEVGDHFEISISSQEAEVVDAVSSIPLPRSFLLVPKENTEVEIINLTDPSMLRLSSYSLNKWGCEFSATSKDASLKHKQIPEGIATHSENSVNAILNTKSALKDLRICLDPGHHPDRGAVGPRGFEERESNLLVAREVAKLLEINGAKVSFTRQEEALPLKERHARIRELKPDLVISIHNNSVGDGQDPRLQHGTQTFYLHPWSRPLAESVHRAIIGRLGTKDLGCVRRNLYITRFHECPTILIEPEYIILPNQEKKFMNPEYRQQLAEAITEGIRNFVNNQISTSKILQ